MRKEEGGCRGGVCALANRWMQQLGELNLGGSRRCMSESFDSFGGVTFGLRLCFLFRLLLGV